MEKARIGLIGLAVMGANLARNIANNNFDIVVYNRTTETMKEFIAEHGNEHLAGEENLEDFVAKLERPRRIIMMVKAGDPVDMVIEQLTPLLEKGDMIIDCGNSNYKDTQRRFNSLEEKGLIFVGCGVSGGEEGALKGPAIMPGGTQASWDALKEILEAIAAKDFSGKPCVTFVGENGAGHYVKMVHNGIEYGVMQMMAEAYEVLHSVYKLTPPQIAEIFKKYNDGKLQSYLFEISVAVLSEKDEFNKDGYLIDYILDKAAQKGTGKWTAIDALDRGISLPTITESVFARLNSSYKDKRVEISKLYPKENTKPDLPLEEFTQVLEDALYAGMLSSYAQGYHLIQAAAAEEGWKIDLAEVSRIWEGGCIIRAKILNTLHETFSKANANMHLFEIPEMQKDLQESVPYLRVLVGFCSEYGVPIPSLAGSLAYFESMTSEHLPANFLQGLRDYFGAHTYNRTDREGTFHTDWDFS